MSDKMKRRNFLENTAVGASALIIGASIAPGNTHAKTKAGKTASMSASKRKEIANFKQLLAPYGVDAKVGSSFTVVSLLVSKFNTGIVTLKDENNHSFQVDICRRDGADGGIANTEHYSLFLRNGGDGSTPTHETRGVAVMLLGAAIRKNEVAVSQMKLASKKEFWAATA
jgi:hypothetical protein